MKALIVLLGVGLACTSRTHGAWTPAANSREASEAPREQPASAHPSSQPPAQPILNVASQHASNEAPVALDVPGFKPALIALPHLDSRPAPVLVAAHGAGDAPEWQCRHWSAVARGRYLVLCPRGLPLGNSGFYYANHFELERELVAALGALRKAHRASMRDGSGVYTGYSQGATMGALMIVEHGADFPYVVLVEGGSSEWSLARAKRFHATGGRSVAFVCGGSYCASRAANSAKLLERSGVRARVEHVEGGGHTYVGAVGERATELFEGWLRE